MEDKIKILETKLKLKKDISSADSMLLWNLKAIAKQAIEVLNASYDGNSKGDTVTHIFTKAQKQVLEDLIYTALSDELVSERTPDHLRQYAHEKQIKQEIYDGL